jgi:hypothetical protein
VANNSSQAIFFAQVTVTYYKADNSVAGTEYTYTFATMIQPGERGAFDNLQQPAVGWVRYALSLSYQTSGFISYSHAFAFSGQNQFSDCCLEYYTGQVTNNSGMTLSFNKVVLTGYNAQGNVVLADFTYANSGNSLSPGAGGPYQLLEDLSQANQATSIAFLAEGQE